METKKLDYRREYFFVIANFKNYPSCFDSLKFRIINLLNKIQIEFIWKANNQKVKLRNLSNEYENGGLRNLSVFSKVVSLKFSWMKMLSDIIFDQCKVINSLCLVNQYLAKGFTFYSNLETNSFVLRSFPNFYQDLLFRRG